MRHSLLNKKFEKGNYYTYGMPEMDRFLQLRKGYNHSKQYDDSENFATIIFYKLFMPCCGSFANYADKHHKEYLSDVYSTSQEGFVLIELMNNYDKWTEKATELYKRNDIVVNSDTNTNQDTESSSEEEIQNEKKNDIPEEGKFTPQGTLYTNSRYCVSMDGWSEAGILKYNSLCKLAEDDRSGEHCRVFETLFKKKESESKVLKEQAIFKQEDFVQPYNNLISSSDDESSDDHSSDDDDSDEIEPENGKANDYIFNHGDLFNEGGRGQEIHVNRKCAV